MRRFWDGSQWTVHLAPAPQSARARGFRLSGRDLYVFLLSAAVGLAVWWPTMAMQPRYDYNHQHHEGSPWYFPVMIGAAIALSVAYARRWWVVAPGLISLQLAVAPFTTPRGDNDGLWGLIFPILVIFGAFLILVSWLTALSSRTIRHTDSGPPS